MPIHCLRCKTKTEEKDGEQILNKKGRPMQVAVCVECGNKKYKFLPKLSPSV